MMSNYVFKIILLSFTASVLLFSGCAKSAPSESGEPFVTFSTDVEENATKGTQLGSGSTLTSFSVTGWNNGTSDHNRFISGYTNLAVTSGTVSTDIRWTKPYDKIFYACANLPASGATVASEDYTGQTLAYTVPTTAAAQNDILMGTYAGDGTSTRTAALNFKHTLTAVVFKTGTLTNVKKITSITLKGVYASGSVKQAADGSFAAWTGTSATQDVAQDITADLPTTAGTAIGVPFILIPQTNSTGIEVEMELTLTDNTTMTCTGTLGKTTGGINWEAGKTNTYTINVSGLNTLSFEYAITPWGDVAGGAITMQDPA